MQVALKKGSGRHHKAGSGGLFTKAREPLHISVTAINLLFLAAFAIQMQFSTADTKPLTLINSEFTHPEHLQLHFRPMDKYAASIYTSHIQIPFNYSGLIHLQRKMNDQLDGFFNTLKNWNFKFLDYEKSTLNSTFIIQEQHK
jgi:hypothetical protein